MLQLKKKDERVALECDQILDVKTYLSHYNSILCSIISTPLLATHPPLHRCAIVAFTMLRSSMLFRSERFMTTIVQIYATTKPVHVKNVSNAFKRPNILTSTATKPSLANASPNCDVGIW